MHYLDTSFIVSALAPDEIASKASRLWLRERAEDALMISHWVMTEVSSALSLKVRTGQLTLDQRTDVHQEWRAFRETSLGLIDIIQDDFLTAASYAERHALNLRAADALHLAIAKRTSCTLMTLDSRMADAARVVGVMVGQLRC